MLSGVCADHLDRIEGRPVLRRHGGEPAPDSAVGDGFHDHWMAGGKFAGCCHQQSAFRLFLEAAPVAAGQAGEDAIHRSQPGTDLLSGHVAGQRDGANAFGQDGGQRGLPGAGQARDND
jgi:hypothetical protein